MAWKTSPSLEAPTTSCLKTTKSMLTQVNAGRSGRMRADCLLLRTVSVFGKDNPATDSQGVITSFRNTSPFSDNPIARVTFKLMPPEKVNDLRGVSGAGALRVSWAESEPSTPAAALPTETSPSPLLTA